jgi:hypothetical protein
MKSVGFGHSLCPATEASMLFLLERKNRQWLASLAKIDSATSLVEPFFWPVP